MIAARTASAHPGLAFPKVVRTPSDDAGSPNRAAHIKAIRALVMQRDEHKCRACESRNYLAMHEIVTRQMLRNVDFRVIFSLRNCIALCDTCHDRAHKKWTAGYWYALQGAAFDIWKGRQGINANLPILFKKVYF